EGYHQSAVGHLSPFIHECRTYYLNSRFTTLTIGKRKDALGRLSYWLGLEASRLVTFPPSRLAPQPNQIGVMEVI
ncbi:hypothetical protein, partial [Aeromonas rivipollensis]|uniref:hypothetical protein n=1 Tax=Aeromonas rivipollensis TaxID=948519 RepID=UPI003D21CC13